MDEVFLTREGYQKLMQELEYLRVVRRKELSKAVGEARLQGDISENAEYDAAKEALAFNERKIAELEATMGRARMLENENIEKDKVLIGATVGLQDVDSGEELEYTFVSEQEADYSQNKISIYSPIGKGLLGHKAGDVVELTIPAGTVRYKILRISR